MSSHKEFRKDSGYAYVILASGFMLRVVEVYTPVTFGIYVLEFLEYFHTDKTFYVTLLGGLYYISQALTGPIGGFLMKRFGVRLVVMTSSVVYAAALFLAGTFPSMAVLTITFVVTGSCSQGLILGGQVAVQQYFDKKRSLAAGIWMSGASWGFFLWPPIARLLIDRYTWRGSYYVYAGIIANGLVFASLLRPFPQRKEVIADVDTGGVLERPKKKCHCELKHLNWFLFLCGMFLLGTGQFAPPVYFPIKADHEHVDVHKIPFVISVIGLTGIILRPVSGFLGDLKYINRLMLTGTTLVLSGISIVMATAVHGFPALMAIAVIAGILQSLYCGTIAAQVVDVFTLENMEIGAGMYGMCFGLGLCVLNPLAGLLIDLTGTTDSVFYVFGSGHILGGLTFAVVSRLTRHLNRNSSIGGNPKNTHMALALSLESINI